jgi:hypothetical protein
MRELLAKMRRNMKVLVGGLFLLGCVAVIASAKKGSGEETITHKASSLLFAWAPGCHAITEAQRCVCGWATCECYVACDSILMMI